MDIDIDPLVEVIRTEEDVHEQICRCVERMMQGSLYPYKTFENGVREAMEWMIGDTDDIPMPGETPPSRQ